MFARLTRTLQEWFRPGEHAHEAAREGMAAYHASRDVLALDKAILDFQEVVDAKREEGRNMELALALTSYSAALWCRFQGHTKAPEDLDKLIASAEEALYLTSKAQGSQHPIYVAIVYELARAHAERYRFFRAYEAETRQSSYKVAIEYFDLTRNSRWDSELHMGVLMRVRCSSEKTSEGIDESIRHLEAGLQTARDHDETTASTIVDDDELQKHRVAMDLMQAHGWFNLAFAHQLRYEHISQDVRDLDIAISYNTKTKTVLEKYRRVDISGCLYKLAEQLWLRWKATHDASDLQQAKAAIERARDAEGNPHDPLEYKRLTDLARPTEKPLKDQIDELFTAIQAAAR